MTTAAEVHDLTYPGRVDPKPGSPLGPDTRNRVWEVAGAVYNPTTNTTAVTVELGGHVSEYAR